MLVLLLEPFLGCCDNCPCGLPKMSDLQQGRDAQAQCVVIEGEAVYPRHAHTPFSTA